MDSNKPSLLEYIKQFSGWTTGVITFLVLQVSFVLLFQKNLQLVTVLIIITTSIALMLVSWKVLSEKTLPLVVGGKGLPRHPKLRRFGIVGLIVIPIINLIFFSLNPGKNILVVALYGPGPDQIVKATTKWMCIGEPFFIIPSNFDLNQPEFELAKSFYSSYSQEGVGVFLAEWGKWDSNPSLIVDITNVQSVEGGTIEHDNTVNIIVDSYEKLDQLELAMFTRNGRTIGFGGCGGGGISNDFSIVNLSNVSNLSTVSIDYDYFTLEPGEYERIVIPFHCSDAGIYHYHLEIDVNHAGKRSQIRISGPITTYCPNSFALRSYNDVIEDDTNSTATYDVRTITYSGSYILNNQDVYTQSTSGRTVTRPWMPCPNAPESYIFPMSKLGMFSPTNASAINIRSEPGLNTTIVKQGPPGSYILLIGDKPSCVDGLVWWHVRWYSEDLNEFGEIYKTDGWVAEGNGQERWLLSCPGKDLVNILHNTYRERVQSTDWCR